MPEGVRRGGGAATLPDGYLQAWSKRQVILKGNLKCVDSLGKCVQSFPGILSKKEPWTGNADVQTLPSTSGVPVSLAILTLSEF